MKKRHEKRLPFFGIGKILPYTVKFRKAMLAMEIFGMAVSVTDIILPLFQRYALDHLIGEKTLDTIVCFLLLYLLVTGIGGGCNAISTRLAAKVEFGVDQSLRNAAFDRLQSLSLSYFNRNSVGGILSRVISDTGRIGELVSWQLMDGLWRLTYLVGSAAVMLSINPGLALMVLSVLPLTAALFVLFQKKLVSLGREIREKNAEITGDFNEAITGARTIKTLALEKLMAKSFRKDTEAMRNKTVKSAHFRGLFAGTVDFASSLALAIVLWKGGILVADQVGTFSLFMSYAQGMMEPMRWLIECISGLVTTEVNIERFTELMETEPDVSDTPEVTRKYGDCFHPKKENWEPIKGDIELQDVTFRYPDGGENVLEHFSLKIPFGTNVAVVGETGTGKSTLANLVCRFYEPTEGKILIDGKDARDRSQLWLHSALGYVLQTPHLFSGTLRENLLYGNPDATDSEIGRALQLVSAQDLVNRLENGLDTDVGEGGCLLSAGEKQLISFARAVLADPRILILDEATASVDTITEQKILSAMDAVIRNRTSIVIAHRLSTISGADVILVMKNGKIVEQGRHKTLMDRKGYYYSLYTRQYEEEETSSLLG